MIQTDTTTRTDVSGGMTGKPLIESDRVEGTAVYDPQGNHLGSIKRLMIEKISGRVAYAVMAFGGFLGLGEEEHTIPWDKLTSCLVAERCWDRVRWAIEEYAWRFDGVRRPSPRRGRT